MNTRDVKFNLNHIFLKSRSLYWTYDEGCSCPKCNIERVRQELDAHAIAGKQEPITNVLDGNYKFELPNTADSTKTLKYYTDTNGLLICGCTQCDKKPELKVFETFQYYYCGDCKIEVKQ